MKPAPRRVSLPVALAIPQRFPSGSRLSPPSPSPSLSPTRRSLPHSPMTPCRRSLPTTPKTMSPRRLVNNNNSFNNNLLPEVEEHFGNTSSSSETSSPRRVKKRRTPPTRTKYSMQHQYQTHQKMSEEENIPEGSIRSFTIKNGQVTDKGYRDMASRRATCPEVWLFEETSEKPVKHVILRIYGCINSGKTTLLNSIDQYATKLVTRYHLDANEGDGRNSKMINFLLNNERIELEVLLESTLENSPFSSEIVMYAVVYSVDNRESFVYATEFVDRLLSKNISTGANIILVGNKVDLKRNTVVSNMEGLCLSKIHKCHFVEVSASLSMNMSQLWSQLLKTIQTPAPTSQSWMEKLLTTGRQLARSAEQIVNKFVN